MMKKKERSRNFKRKEIITCAHMHNRAYTMKETTQGR